MSEQTIKVDQFLLNTLQPSIDSFNFSLMSMEENGYDNKPMRDTKNKLNKLTVMYDFLKEYAYGKEIVDDSTLNDLLKIAGAFTLSTKSQSQIIQSTRDSLDINTSSTCLDFIRIYINDEILKTELLPPLLEPTTLKIYGPNTTTSIEVTITVTGSYPILYRGDDHVTIKNIQLNDIDGLTLNIITKNICGDTHIYHKDFLIQDTTYYNTLYWIGSTEERFTINTDIIESSDISKTPNNGTNQDEIFKRLTYDWVINDLDMTEFMYREDAEQTITAKHGDSHVILMIPSSLVIDNIKELVYGIQPVDMLEHLHYDSFQIISPDLKHYNCIYFRDLTHIVFPDNSPIPDRIFQFNISKV